MPLARLRGGTLALEALEEVAEALGRDAGALEHAQGVHIGLALGNARIAQLGQHEADIANRACRPREDELGGGGQAHGPDEAGLRMQLERVTELVRQHAGDLIGRARRLHQAARQDDVAAGHRERVDQPPVEQHHPHRHGAARCRCGEALGEPIESGATGRRLAGLVVLGKRGDEIPPEHLARLLRHAPRHGLRRVQLEKPCAHGDGEHHAHRGQAGPERPPALTCGGERGGAAQELAGERGICHEQRLAALGLQAQQHISGLGAQGNAAAQQLVGPQPRRQTFGGEQLQAAVGEAHLDGSGAGRATVAERARKARGVRMRRH